MNYIFIWSSIYHLKNPVFLHIYGLHNNINNSAGALGNIVSNTNPQTIDKSQMNNMKHEDSVFLLHTKDSLKLLILDDKETTFFRKDGNRLLCDAVSHPTRTPFFHYTSKSPIGILLSSDPSDRL